MILEVCELYLKAVKRKKYRLERKYSDGMKSRRQRVYSWLENDTFLSL